MSTLYELTGEYLALSDMLMDDEVDEQTVLDTLEAIKGELEIKAEGYIAVMKELEAREKTFDQEMRDWKHKKEVESNAKDRLKTALFNAMVATGHDDKTGLDTGKHVLKIIGNGGLQPLIIDIPAEELPPIFQKVTITADTEKIRGMLAKGEEVTKEYPWAHLEPRGRRLSIK
jgi:hypothetical protein